MSEPGAALDARTPRSVVVALALLALLVRGAHLLHVTPTPIAEYHREFRESDMYMFDQWARRIAGGDVLGRETYHPLNQWQLATAPVERWREWYGDRPTFYKSPFYPYLIAGLYRCFGDSLVPLLTLQILASCLSVALLYATTVRVLGRRPAFAAALLFALYGPAVHYDVLMLRGPWIVLVSLLATWQLVGLQKAPTPSRALWLGVTAGVSLLVNEGFLTAPPLLMALLAFWHRGLRRLAGLWGAFGLGFFLALAPLFLRNLAVGAPPLQLAVTGSTVYAVFNSAGTSPYFFEARQASFVPVLLESGGNLGKTVWACLRSFPTPWDALLFYARKASGLAIPFENPDNASFYYAALKDPMLAMLPGYGLVLPLSLVGLVASMRHRLLGAMLPWMPFAVSILISIMIAIPLSRYRATLAVYLMPLAGLAVSSATRWWKERAFAPLAAAAGAALVVTWAGRAWQAKEVFAAAPEGIYLYRPPEFLLGADIQARRGHYALALRELLDLLRLNPDPSFRPTALLLAAGLQARSGDVEAARDTVRVLLRSRREDPVILMAAGDFLRDALEDPDMARRVYEQALELRPPVEVTAQLRDRLERRAGAPATP